MNLTQFLRCTLLLTTILAMGGVSAWSQDVLVTEGDESSARSKRKGLITEWLGNKITLESSGRARQVDADQVIEIQTTWPETYQVAMEMLQQKRFADAVGPLQTAINSETRPWAQRAMAGKLIECYLATGNEGLAVDEFVAITRADPQTRFYNLAPLPWVSTMSNTGVTGNAGAWMESTNPVERLMGSAWSLAGPQRNSAITVLKDLAGNGNASIAALAKSQLWRTESVSAKPDKVRRWRAELQAMPTAVRAGAYLMLADAQARNQMEEQAAINLMRIPILYPEQHGLAAAALYRCAQLRQNAGHLDESRTLWTEIERNYRNTLWAKQATAHLTESNSNN